MALRVSRDTHPYAAIRLELGTGTSIGNAAALTGKAVPAVAGRADISRTRDPRRPSIHPARKITSTGDAKLGMVYVKAFKRLRKVTDQATKLMVDGLDLVYAGKNGKAVERFESARTMLLVADDQFQRAQVPAEYQRLHNLMRQGLAVRIDGLTQMAHALGAGREATMLLSAGRQRHETADIYFAAALEAFPEAGQG